MQVTIGIPAHNEEANIAKLLDNLIRQTVPDWAKIQEILVVADGTDRTVEIVKDFQNEHAAISVINEEGSLMKKFNTMLGKARGEILVVVNADTLPRRGTLELLIKPFKDEKVGSVIGKGVPVNDPESFWGYVHHLFYKCNYLPEFLRVDFEGACALRQGAVKRVPLDILDYETYVDAVVVGKGYRIVYAPAAVTYMKAPDNLQDFLNQRRRTFFMHLQTQRKLKTPMSRLSLTKVLIAVLKNLSLNPKKLVWFLTISILSAYCYVLAQHDLANGKSYFMWNVVPSTKTINLKTDV